MPHWFDVLMQDIRYAWRSVARTPGFTILVVATMALGVGVNTAMFGFLDRIFLRAPAGVDEPSQLRRLWITRYRNDEASTYQNVSYPSYLALKDVAGSNANLAFYITSDGVRIGRDRSGPPVHVVYSTSNYFDVLGVRPVAGRVFSADEDIMGAGTNVAVISHVFWQQRLGGDPNILGKTVALALTPYTIIGVLPPEFVGLDVQSADIWIPLGAFPGRARQGVPWYKSQTTYGARIILRTKTGFDDNAFAAQATVALDRVEREVRRGTFPTKMTMTTGSIIEARGAGELSQETRIATRVAGVALIVLFIACANVINLLLARAVHRRREIAVRLALGISRARLIRLLTTESMLLALMVSAAAILTAWWGGGLLRALLLPNVEWIDSGLDGRVVTFGLMLALVAGFVAGLVPAIQASNPQLATALKSGAREGSVQRSRLRDALVILQAAFSLMLVVGAALFVRTLQNVKSIDIGYDAQRTLMAEVDFEASERPAAGAIAAAMQGIASRLENRPDVEHVARTSISPMRGYGVQTFYTDRDSLGTVSSDVGPMFSAVSPNFFVASGLRILRGRTFSSSEYGAAVDEVVLNAMAARALFPDRDPLGQCVRFGKRDNPCHTVVGIAENNNTMELIEPKKGNFFVPLGSSAAREWLGTAIVVRVRPEAMPAVRSHLEREIRREFSLGYPTLISMDERLDTEYQPWRLGATLFTAFGALALLVALVGIYSTITYTVGQRTHEFGVRIALGARMRDVIEQVVSEGMRVVGIGVVAGIVLSLAAGRLVRALLFGVESSDPAAMLLGGCTMLLVAAAATLRPAWRAARVDPMTALRAE